MTSEDVELALSQLLRAELSSDDVLLYRTSNPDEFDRVLEWNIERLGHHEQHARICEVGWLAFGPEKCESIFPIMPRPGLDRFLEQRLASNPEEFSEGFLQQLSLVRPQKCGVTDQIQFVRTNRVRNTIEHQRSLLSEFTTDLARLKQHVVESHLPPELNALLEKVEEEFGKGDEFDCAAIIMHLRTFLEQLAQSIALGVHEKNPRTKDGTVLAKFGQAIEFLRRVKLIDIGMLRLGQGLYSVLSEEGVHAISSDQEYVRLCRNMVVEYSLVLFWELDRWVPEPQ